MYVNKYDLKKGTTIVLTEGAYDEYSFDPPFKVLVDFNLKEAMQRFADSKPLRYTNGEVAQGQLIFLEDTRGRYRNEYFIKYLSEQGFVAKLEPFEQLHTADYGQLWDDLAPTL